MKFGDFEIDSVSDGFIKLDGGAMFGVVPRTVWEKTNPPDEKNRIRLALNSLLIRCNDWCILVDTGIGGKGDEKFRSRYGVERKPTLQESLTSLGLRREDISMVINTHLHFDHAGGNTIEKDDGTLIPAFPHARYMVQRGEWEEALNPNERTKGSYRPMDFVPIMDAGQFELLDGDQEIIPGVSVFKTSGHNRHIQLVKIESKGKTCVFLSDIIPTASHLPYPFIMGFDLFPLDTLRVKKELLKKAAEEKWLLFFEHDPGLCMGYVGIRDNTPFLEK